MIDLEALGAPESIRKELLDYVATPYRGPLPPTLPLPDEAHLDCWRRYVRESEEAGVASVLTDKLVQLRFPVAEGMSSDPAYLGAVRRGDPPPASPPLFEQPDSLRLHIEETLAGAVPVVVAGCRADFLRLVRALARRNEPEEVPDAVGAYLVSGLINQDRVKRHRRKLGRQRGRPLSEQEWQVELARLAPKKALYQDRVLLLSRGPYSNVDAATAGRGDEQWLSDSLRIRLDHELFHYQTLRFFGTLRSNLLDELLADMVGLLSACGTYSLELALRFLGVEPDASLRPGSRLEVYRGDGLSDEALGFVARLAVPAAKRLEHEVREHRDTWLDDREMQQRMALDLAAFDLTELASPSPLSLLPGSWLRTSERVPETTGWESHQPASATGVRETLESFEDDARERELAPEARRQLALVLDEILSNIALHAYPEHQPGEMSVQLKFLSPRGYRLLFEDRGRPFNPLYQAIPETLSPLSERRAGGLGIYLVRRLSAKLFYERRGERNRLSVEMKALD